MNTKSAGGSARALDLGRHGITARALSEVGLARFDRFLEPLEVPRSPRRETAEVEHVAQHEHEHGAVRRDEERATGHVFLLCARDRLERGRAALCRVVRGGRRVDVVGAGGREQRSDRDAQHEGREEARHEGLRTRRCSLDDVHDPSSKRPLSAASSSSAATR
jgi:hypothetical protein